MSRKDKGKGKEMEPQQIFGLRLKSARALNGLSLEELASRMENKISKQSLSKYEAGKMMPSSTVLIMLGKALNVKPDYFLRPFTVSIEKIEFRKKSKIHTKEEKAIKEKIRDKMERYIEVEQILCLNSDFVNPLKNNHINSAKDVYTMAASVRDAWQIGRDGIPCIVDMLEEHCIKVVALDASDAFDGLSGFVDERKPIIVLNRNFTAERKRFTAMHELGHLLLSFNPRFSQKEIEHLCNLFANEILIPYNVFKKIIGVARHDISLNELRAIQLNFGISVDALMFKAKDLHIITQSRYKYFCIQKNKDINFKKQVEKSYCTEEPSTRFASLVYRALASDLISFSKASALLAQPIEEVRHQLELV